MTAKVSPVPPALAGKGNLVRERPQKALESQIYGIWYNYAGMQFHGLDMLVNDVEKRSQSRFAGDHHGASGESDGRVTGVTAKKASRTARRIRGWPTGGLEVILAVLTFYGPPNGALASLLSSTFLSVPPLARTEGKGKNGSVFVVGILLLGCSNNNSYSR